MITAVIVDDEKKSRETLAGLVERYCPDVRIVGEADGFKSGIEVLNDADPDVVFLDIQMPDGSGFKLLEEIDNPRFFVIFTTAYDQFAIKAIKYSALDYLLKPIVPDDLVDAVEKLKTRKNNRELNNHIKVLLENMRTKSDDHKKIVLSTSDKMQIVEVKDILRCESDDYYTRFFFMNGQTLLVSKTLKEHEELLRDHNFVRPHKSHLVNIRYIKSFMKHDGGYIVMSDGSKIPVSRRKKEKVLDIIQHL